MSKHELTDRQEPEAKKVIPSCAACGEDSQVVITCEICSDFACLDCSGICESCCGDICKACVTECDNCDDGICTNCAKECAVCEEPVCWDCWGTRNGAPCDDCQDRILETCYTVDSYEELVHWRLIYIVIALDCANPALGRAIAFALAPRSEE